jgi:NADH pyrophosphatase NudC (nudix superfamily)
MEKGDGSVLVCLRSLLLKGDSIVKCSCKAEVSAHARFCPHCGRPLAHELDQSATAPLSESKTTRMLLRNGSRKEGGQVLIEATTLKEADWIPPLPPKYKASLQLGTAPELVMWEMFKRIIELRNLLEETVTSWPPGLSNNQIERSADFLRSHCASCGDHMHQAENGNTLVCTKCQNM